MKAKIFIIKRHPLNKVTNNSNKRKIIEDADLKYTEVWRVLEKKARWVDMLYIV